MLNNRVSCHSVKRTTLRNIVSIFESTIPQAIAFQDQKQRSRISSRIVEKPCSVLTHCAGPSCVITQQHETNRRIRYYRVPRKRSTDGRYQDERTKEQTDGCTDGQTARARWPSELWSKEKTVRSETSKGPGLVQLRAPATPALSPIIRVRFEVSFSGPLGGQGAAREPPQGIATQTSVQASEKQGTERRKRDPESKEQKERKRDKERERDWSTSDPLCGVCRQTRIDSAVLE